MAALIRQGLLTSRDAVEAHIAQIRRVNPTLNAVVAERFALARQEADDADSRRRASAPGDLPPFHGVPCTVKENFLVRGMPQASGLVGRRHLMSASDAPAVTRYREAGLIPVGVTNTSELCMWMESDNRVYGRTNNPYDADRLVGGSSGGEAAIIGAGGSPVGLGSDIGGSIRGPCFFNGIFGHKPSAGLIPNTGQFPLPDNEAKSYLTTGPMVRRAADLWPLLKILAGPDGEDDACRELPLGDPSSVEIRGRRVISVPDNGRLEVSDELRAAQEAALRALERLGAKVEERRFRLLRHQAEIWSAGMSLAQEESFGSMLGQGEPIRPGVELLKAAFGRSRFMVPSLVLALTDPVPGLFPDRTLALRGLGERLRAEIAEALGDDGVLLYPTYTTPAPRHGLPVWHMVTLRLPFAYQGIFNVLGLPATQVPLGLGREGLPLGCQVISRHGADHVTVRVAEILEQQLGGWVPPAVARID